MKQLLLLSDMAQAKHAKYMDMSDTLSLYHEEPQRRAIYIIAVK